MKTIYVVALSFLLASCNQNGEKDTESCDPSQHTCLFDVSSIANADLDDPLPNEALTFETNLVLMNFTASRQDKINQATELIKKIVASEEFREAVINHTYNGKKTFVDNGGLTNVQIYHRFLLGAEKLSPEQNNTLDAEIELYYDSSSTIGYTNPTTRRIWMNTKFYDNYTSAQVAGNLTHEWLHKLGFGHATTSTPSRPYSVPYAIGYIIKRLAAQSN